MQRYRCKAPACPVTTFSILPFPLLRIVRHAYRTVLEAQALTTKNMSQAAVGRALDVTRGVARRLSELCRRLVPFIEREQKGADWGPQFESDPCSVWPRFIRDFSHAFYLRRYGKFSPTQYEPI